ncbi:MAG: chalcone isomerase family protein [Bacteroidota bacterium]|jgi:hypothetical protein
MKKYALDIIILTILFPLVVLSQETVKEPSTGKVFPAMVKFTHEGKEYVLAATGLTVRKKVIFKVYGMVHYMEEPTRAGSEEDAFNAVLTDGKAKQITLDFARDVDAAKIKEAYADGFKQHASPEDLQKIQSLIDQFTGYFAKDVKENEQFVFRWLPGGSIIAIVQGEQKPIITNGLFAQALWSIWFGKDSIVDRSELIERMLKK